MDKTSMTLGYLVGRQIAGQRRAVKQPIAFLYNGVRLPPLPEWDKTVYPYAVIQYAIQEPGWGGADVVRFRALKAPWTTDGEYIIPGESVEQFFALYTTSRNEWISISNTPISAEARIDNAIWTSHDIVNSADGSIYLEATDPIPVYE